MQLAAGLVLAGFDGTEVADPAFIARCAGTILFARNVVDARQTSALVRSLQAAAVQAGAPPLIVAIDEEGGTVSRIAAIGTRMPSAMALGAGHLFARTRAVYRASAEEMSELGITLDLAPVADLTGAGPDPVIGTRSFGGDPARVADHVRAAIEGLHDGGVATAAKHFPGHGDVPADSHVELPHVERDIERLRRVEFVPFRAAIEAGTDCVMSAHLALPLIDDSRAPATLSRPLLGDLLRGELGYAGVICTDCLEMKAIAANWSPGEAAVAALHAGADLLLFSSSAAAALEAIAAVDRAIEDGTLSETRVRESLARIDALRRHRWSVTTEGDFSRLGSDLHRRLAEDAVRASITVVRDPNGVLPMPADAATRTFVVQFLGADDGGHASSGKVSTAFGKRLAGARPRVQEQIRSLDPAGQEFKQLLMASAAADTIVAVTRDATAHPLQARAVGDLSLAGKPLIVIASRSPFDAAIAPPDAAVIATYGDDDLSLAAAADVILGVSAASGVSPVTLGSAAGVAALRPSP